MDKRTALIVTASTAIGFVGDVLIYSLAESKGKQFKIAVPKGAELVKLIALGIIGGLAIDYTIKKVEYAAMNEQERTLAKLVEAEKQRIAAGQRNNLVASSILWSPQVAA